MHPLLFRLGPVAVHSYGTMIVIGFLAGMALARLRARGLGLDPRFAVDISYLMLLSGLAGAKLLYFIVEVRYVAETLAQTFQHPGELLHLLGSGFVFYGGLAGAAACAVVYIGRRGQPLWPTWDLLAPSAMLGLGFGRIGCFLSGCCYGRACSGRICVTFTDPASLAPAGIARYPTQLFEMAACFAIAVFLVWFTPRRRFDGQVFWLMVLAYGAARFAIECFRGDDRGLVPLVGLSTSQALAIASGIVAAVYWRRLARRRRP